MSELVINGERYEPVAQVAKRVGYTSDYLTKLAREKKIIATKVNRRWLVSADSVEEFFGALENHKVRERLKIEQRKKQAARAHQVLKKQSYSRKRKHISHKKLQALSQAMVVVVLGLVCGVGGYVTSQNQMAFLSGSSSLDFFEEMAINFYTFISRDRRHGVHDDVVTSRATAHVATVQEEPAHDQTPTAPRVSRQGVVVLPSDSASGSSAAQLEEYFSDDLEVVFQQHGVDRGVIVPQFKDGSGTPHHFILVAIPEE